MTNIKQNCYKRHQKKHIMRKSYGVTLSPVNKLCNSTMILTPSFRTVISDRQVTLLGLLRS
ncbi:hypothetical protein ELQ57_11650 [Salmonella enterica subsp. enterica serovar Teko]|nr:hypothetical protein [Salmonella enterica]EBH8911587.1 hypothetical protein [Salmonella enterica subsp. enterica serovar Teko]EDV9142677.1 hypothetical protein [Salmonella enterica subsp. enterica serovar Gombe]EDV9731277.1 hypothetical protein [Salmonella enterica subsp. enterica]EAQ5175261.1 hypothetical protein [Salmonella enterica]